MKVEKIYLVQLSTYEWIKPYKKLKLYSTNVNYWTTGKKKKNTNLKYKRKLCEHGTNQLSTSVPHMKLSSIVQMEIAGLWLKPYEKLKLYI